MTDYNIRMVVSLDHATGESLAFQLFFDDIPAHPMKGGGYHAMYHAALYLLSVLWRDGGVGQEDLDGMMEEVKEGVEKLAAMPEVTGNQPDIPGYN